MTARDVTGAHAPDLASPDGPHPAPVRVQRHRHRRVRAVRGGHPRGSRLHDRPDRAARRADLDPVGRLDHRLGPPRRRRPRAGTGAADRDPRCRRHALGVHAAAAPCGGRRLLCRVRGLQRRGRPAVRRAGGQRATGSGPPVRQGARVRERIVHGRCRRLRAAVRAGRVLAGGDPVRGLRDRDRRSSRSAAGPRSRAPDHGERAVAPSARCSRSSRRCPRCWSLSAWRTSACSPGSRSSRCGSSRWAAVRRRSRCRPRSRRRPRSARWSSRAASCRRIGLRTLFTVSSLLYTVAFLLWAVLASPVAIIASRLISGTAYSGLWIASVMAIQTLLPSAPPGVRARP